MTKGYVEAKDPRYQAWIDKNTDADPYEVQGQCYGKADAMAKEFPELTVVGTSYHGLVYGSEHAWCITDKGEIVDPTAHQFGRKYNYPDDPMHKEDFPTGKCWICGELNYPDTEHNRRHFDEDALGEHTYCLAQMEREYAQIDEEMAAGNY